MQVIGDHIYLGITKKNDDRPSQRYSQHQSRLQSHGGGINPQSSQENQACHSDRKGVL